MGKERESDDGWVKREKVMTDKKRKRREMMEEEES